jgi:hypothetical protein
MGEADTPPYPSITVCLDPLKTTLTTTDLTLSGRPWRMASESRIPGRTRVQSGTARGGRGAYDRSRRLDQGTKSEDGLPMKRRLYRSVMMLTALSAIALASAGCATRTVNQILADPSRYRDRDVRVSGAVVDSYSFVDRGAYRIDDGTGQLWVVSDKGVPRTSARGTVKGRIRDGFNLGSLGDRI